MKLARCVILALAGLALVACVPALVTPESPTPTPEPVATPTPEDDGRGLEDPLRRALAPAIEDLAGRLDVPADEIEVVSAEEVDWPDAGLGCPAPDMMYAQVITPGMRAILAHGGEEYAYHGTTPATLFLCGPDGPTP